MERKAYYDLVSVFGGVVLFSSWVFQQTALDQTNAELKKIDAAEELYRTYQSNNAIFNAIIEQNKNNEANIRRFQTYNYGLGLAKLSEVAGQTPLIGYDIPLSDMQRHLETVQKLVAEKRKALTEKAGRLHLLFLVAYGFGSFLALLGSILKLNQPKS